MQNSSSHNYVNPYCFPGQHPIHTTNATPFSENLPASGFTFGSSPPADVPYLFSSVAPVPHSDPTFRYTPQQILTSDELSRGSFRAKRKSSSPPPSAVKQHITEERMARQLARLHIGGDTSNDFFASSSSLPSSSSSSDEEPKKRLYMCPEMQNLPDSQDVIFSRLLKDSYGKLCTALVPWVPPIVDFPPLAPNNNDISISDSNSDNNNNNDDDCEGTMETDSA